MSARHLALFAVLAVLAVLALVFASPSERNPPCTSSRREEPAPARGPAALAPPGRVPAPAPQVAAPEAQGRRTLDVDPGVLHVSVVASATREPLSGIRVFLSPERRHASWSGGFVGRETASAGQIPLTDARGEARFLVLPRVPFVAHVASARVGASNLAFPMEGLRPGETRLLVAEVELARLQSFHGRVLDGETGVGLAGAIVTVRGRRHDPVSGTWVPEARNPTRVVCGSDGSFVLPHGRHLTGSALELEFPGYANALGRVSGEHYERGRPRTYRLSRGAALSMRLIEPDETPVAGVRVAVTTDGRFSARRHPRKRKGVTDALGNVRLEGLPASVLLRVSLSRALVPEEQPGDSVMLVGGEAVPLSLPARTLPHQVGPFLLVPGEHREETVVLEPGQDVCGRVLDASGSAATGARVRIRDLGGEAFTSSFLDGVRTDEQGLFCLRDVGPGTSVIEVLGPAEESRVSEEVLVRPGERPAEIVLRLRAGER